MRSYAQDGEDLLLDELLGKKRAGFYIDVGAADFYGNTQFFYERGWRGVNIEPHPYSYQRLVANRPYDMNVHSGVAEIEGELTFYAVPERKTRSTFHKHVADNCGFPYETISVPVAPLHVLLDGVSSEIDFMSIDTEGSDEIVLRTNDWSKHRPRLILIETVSPAKTPWEAFLESCGYDYVARTKYNAVYRRRD